MVTKRSLRVVVACSWVVLAALAAGGCIAQSPVVGKEDDGVDGTQAAPGRVDLLGIAEFFSAAVTAATPPGTPEVGSCLGRPLPLDDDDAVACSVFSARKVGAGECHCDGRPPIPSARAAVEQELVALALCGEFTGVECSDFCVCEEPPVADSDLYACQHDPKAPVGVGWCYIDPARGIGSEDLLTDCPETQPRKIRFLSRLESAAIYILVCSGGTLAPGSASPGPGALGTACIPSAERDPRFNGFPLSAVNVEFGSPDCESNICLVNHFQGRVSCPYGQTGAQNSEWPPCYLPESDTRVIKPVDPQLIARRAQDHVVCSCRCDGPDPDASYCQCPSGMECAPLAPARGAPGEELYAGSYCIPQGTQYSPAQPPPPDFCDPFSSYLDCGDPRPY